MIRYTGVATTNTILEIQGHSTDPKPVLQDHNTGSSFWEYNTGNLYIWHIDEWKIIA
jgi:hypothetical protein